MKLLDYRGRGISNTQIAQINLKLRGVTSQQILWNGICFADMYRRDPFESMQNRYLPSGGARKVEKVSKYVHFVHTPKTIEWLTDDLLDRYLSICLQEMPDYIRSKISIEYISQQDFEGIFLPEEDLGWCCAGWEQKKFPRMYGTGRRAITINNFGQISGSELFYILNLFRVPTEHPVVVGGTVCVYDQVKNEPWFRLVHPSFIHPLTAYLYAVPSGHKIWKQSSLKQDWYKDAQVWNPWQMMWSYHINDKGEYQPYVKQHAKMYEMEDALAIGMGPALIRRTSNWTPADAWELFLETLRGEVVKFPNNNYDWESPNRAFGAVPIVPKEIILD